MMRAFTDTSSRAAETLLSLVVIAILLRLLAGTTYHSAIAPSGIQGVDYEQYYLAAQRLRDGHSLYAGRIDYPYSPLEAVIMRPLLRFSQAEASRKWALVSTALLALATGMFCWAQGVHPIRRSIPFCLIFLTGFRYWPTVIELGIGNVDMLGLALVCGMFVADRYRKYIIVGVLMGLAALVKTWMIGLLLYLLLQKRYRAAIVGFACYIFGLSVLFTLCGWRQFPEFIHITRVAASQPWLVTLSALGITRMFFSPNPHLHPISTDPQIYRVILGVMYACIAGGVISLLIPSRESPLQSRQLRLAMVLAAMVLGLPLCHLYYYIFVLPLMWMLFLRVGSGSSFSDVATFVAALIAYVLLSMPSPGMTPIPAEYKQFPRSLMVAIPFVAGAVLFAAGICVIVATRNRTATPSHAEVDVATAKGAA